MSNKREPGDKGKLFVLSGPSGSGKTTLAAAVLGDKELSAVLERSVSFTTRPRRRGEKNKRDYFFISEEEFLSRRRKQKILEWTRYLGYYYGTDKDFVDSRLEKSKSLILCLDLKGAARIKKLYRKNSITVFVMPPSLEELSRRIECRHRETSGREIAGRLRLAKKEVACSGEFDFCLVNNKLSLAVRDLKKIISAEIF